MLEWRGGLVREYTLAYLDVAGDEEDVPSRRQGDAACLAALSARQLAAASFGSAFAMIGELPEETLRDVLTEIRHRHDGWDLAGDRSMSVLRRIDSHFLPMHELAFERQRQRDRLAEEQATRAQAAEREARLAAAREQIIVWEAALATLEQESPAA